MCKREPVFCRRGPEEGERGEQGAGGTKGRGGIDFKSDRFQHSDEVTPMFASQTFFANCPKKSGFLDISRKHFQVVDIS